jgi:hypothetical protein
MFDGYKSYVFGDFKLYCKKHNTIILYIPAYSSHIFQSLDVACFRSLKQVHSKIIERILRQLLIYTAKKDFLPLFEDTFFQVFIHNNIQLEPRGTGIVTFDTKSVISKLDMRLRTPTPPGSFRMNAALWVLKTPLNPTEAHSQSIFLDKRIFEYQSSFLISILAAIDHFAKDTK